MVGSERRKNKTKYTRKIETWESVINMYWEYQQTILANEALLLMSVRHYIFYGI